MPAMRDWIDKRFPLTEFVERHITKYSTPRNLNYLWNFGSLAGAFLLIQILTGIWLAMYYKPDTKLAFDSVQYIMRDVHYGWLIRYLHALGPTVFFFAVYIHMARALFYGSYREPRELLWWIGLAIYLALMAEAFMGYLLPWGQMSYWGATVITNLFSAIPYIGSGFVIWLRGDFSVGDATLGRFFSLHTTTLPIGVIGGLVVMHLVALHRVGSNNPTGVEPDNKGPAVIPFAPYFITKDLWFISSFLTLYLGLVFFYPDFFLEPFNNEAANPLVTPPMTTEWYFLPFYAIVKSIPHKFGGVIAMFGAILILAFLPYLDRSPVRSARYRPVKKILTWLFFLNFLVLGYTGAQLPVGAVLFVGRIATAYYFLYFLLLPLIPYFEKAAPLPREEEL